MKRTALFLSLVLCLGVNAFAQTNEKDEEVKAAPAYYKNIVKTNLSSLALNNYSLTYERMLTRKISASLGWRFMPKTQMDQTALTKEVMNHVEDGDGEISEQLGNLNASGNAITAEFRIYTGSRPGAKGFYAGVYGRYSSFKFDFPYDFDMEMGGTKRVPFNAKANGIGAGVILGGQFAIAKRVMVDLFIVGGHYGSFKGNVEGLTDLSQLSAQDKEDLKDDLESLVQIGDKKNITATVQNDGIRADIDMPFIGVRGLGLTVGFAF